MQRQITTLILVLIVIAGLFYFARQSDDITETDTQEPFTGSDVINEIIVIPNVGDSMEGHTPRGFAGMGTGLFVGDNLNPNFPDGDGVQMFLTFNLRAIEGKDITSVTLRSAVPRIEGTPFVDLGVLRAEEIRYDRFSRELWNLEAREFLCIFSDSSAGQLSCDVTEAVQNSLDDNYSLAQFRVLFDKAGDSDGEQDMLFFNTGSDSNVNEPGIFELVVE